VHRLAADTADVLVVGGGITGAGIARDAAMRGLRTVLVEQSDLGAGTSSHSSRLIHGGLRYLEEGNLHLVYEALAERRVLLDIAPHLIHPLAFVFPVHRGDRVPLWKLAGGVWLYTLLALFRNVGGHSILGKRGLLRAEPAVRERGLTGGVRYHDAQCDDARLVIATARSAIRHGARMANYARVEGLDQADGKVRGARVRDLLTEETATVYARVVVNATGPWSDNLRRLEDAKATPVLRPTKGAHVMVSRARLGNRGAITMTSPIDGRVMFTLPWGEFAYIGTTDSDSSETPDHVTASADDVVYLLRSANAYFPNAHLSEHDVVATWAGLRPLLGGTTKLVGASHVSREHAILEGLGGMLSIVGGKLTTYRRMAAQMVDLVVQKLERLDGRRLPHRAATDQEPLPGGEARDVSSFTQVGLDLGLAPRTVEHLLRHYGDETAAVLNLARERRSLMTPLMPEHPAIEAEVVHIARRELAQRVEDVLVRRIHLYYETGNHGATAADRVAALMGEELGWGAERVGAEADRYRQWLVEQAGNHLGS
jgi:glycerol-3-phosphate dehydrogenase